MIIFTRQQLKEVLKDPKAGGLKEPYYLTRNPNGQQVTILTAGKNGDEFNKTYGYIYVFPEVEIYQVAYGRGVLIFQKNDETGEAKEVRVVSLKPGVTVEVPTGWVRCLVNVGKSFLIVLDNSIVNKNAYQTEIIKAKRGLVYYVVEKKGEISFEPNRNYRIHPQISVDSQQ